MLTLNLKKMPSTVLGIYGKNGDIMADRMLYLAPDAADSYLQMDAEKRVRVSDMFRDANGSLVALQSKKGVQWPGYSGHGFGFSIDDDLEWQLHAGNGFADKGEFDEWMNSHGWFCHRLDHKSEESEAWHYNFFGAATLDDLLMKGEKSTSGALERKIIATYGDQLKLELTEAQALLQKLKLYTGDVDGLMGPHTAAAISSFQRTWCLDRRPAAQDEQGKLGPITQRTLAYVCAQKFLAGDRVPNPNI